MDGANAWQRFWHITLPCLRPTTFFVLVMLTIESFKVFDLILVMTDGGPGRSTLVLSQLIYRKGIRGTVRLRLGHRAGAVRHRAHRDRRPVPSQRAEERLMTALHDAPPAVAARGGRPADPGPGPGRRLVRTALAYVAASSRSALVVLVPFSWMVSSSLKRNNEVFTVPIQWIPEAFRWPNYVDIWTRIPLTT